MSENSRDPFAQLREDEVRHIENSLRIIGGLIAHTTGEIEVNPEYVANLRETHNKIETALSDAFQPIDLK